jgi:hypothetical protein
MHQLVLQVDDLIQPGAKRVAFRDRRRRLVASLRSATTMESCPAIRGNFEKQIANLRPFNSRKFAIANPLTRQKPIPAQRLWFLFTDD